LLRSQAGTFTPVRGMYILFWFVIVAGVVAFTLTGLQG
jgi:hypothetical protein